MDILLVDDDEMVLKTIGESLAERGHNVRTAADGLRALQAVEQAVPDLVICDIQMPNLDGLSFLRSARERYPGIPIVLMSGDRELDTAVTGFRSGARDYLKKPIDLKDLLRCVDAIANRN